MDSKMMAAFALIAIAGAAFAFGGFGMGAGSQADAGFGREIALPENATGSGWQMHARMHAPDNCTNCTPSAGWRAGNMTMPSWKNATDEVRIEFMKAMHEGDYATAKSLNEEYGLGGPMLQDEQAFSLRYQMRQAMDNGDYAQALELQKQMGGLARENAPGPMDGRGMGQRGNRGAGCPFAEEGE